MPKYYITSTMQAGTIVYCVLEEGQSLDRGDTPKLISNDPLIAQEVCHWWNTRNTTPQSTLVVNPVAQTPRPRLAPIFIGETKAEAEWFGIRWCQDANHAGSKPVCASVDDVYTRLIGLRGQNLYLVGAVYRNEKMAVLRAQIAGRGFAMHIITEYKGKETWPTH